jgi:hypothetical protein
MNENPGGFGLQPFQEGMAYELRIKGRLVQTTLAWFEDMDVTVDETVSPPQTVISGLIRDQAALYGLISRIRDLGLQLLSVNVIEQEEGEDGET